VLRCTSHFRNGSRLCKNAVLVGRTGPDRQIRFHARIASINPPTPRMRITRQSNAKKERALSRSSLFRIACSRRRLLMATPTENKWERVQREALERKQRRGCARSAVRN